MESDQSLIVIRQAARLRVFIDLELAAVSGAGEYSERNLDRSSRFWGDLRHCRRLCAVSCIRLPPHPFFVGLSRHRVGPFSCFCDVFRSGLYSVALAPSAKLTTLFLSSWVSRATFHPRCLAPVHGLPVSLSVGQAALVLPIVTEKTIDHSDRKTLTIMTTRTL